MRAHPDGAASACTAVFLFVICVIRLRSMLYRLSNHLLRGFVERLACCMFTWCKLCANVHLHVRHVTLSLQLTAYDVMSTVRLQLHGNLFLKIAVV